MASLTFDIVESDIDLIMRDCTAHHICRQHGLNVPPAIAEAHQVQVQTPPRVSSSSTASSPAQLDFWGGVLGGTIAPKRQLICSFKHGGVSVAGARRARLDRRGAAREGLAAAASSAAGGNASAIAELLAVAQL